METGSCAQVLRDLNGGLKNVDFIPDSGGNIHDFRVGNALSSSVLGTNALAGVWQQMC